MTPLIFWIVILTLIVGISGLDDCLHLEFPTCDIFIVHCDLKLLLDPEWLYLIIPSAMLQWFLESHSCFISPVLWQVRLTYLSSSSNTIVTQLSLLQASGFPVWSLKSWHIHKVYIHARSCALRAPLPLSNVLTFLHTFLESQVRKLGYTDLIPIPNTVLFS